MEEYEAIKALGALAQEHRLKVFRLLLQQLPQGLPAGQIAMRIGTSASTMSSHLAQLERAGLLRSWREQRHIFYAANLDGVQRLLSFLTEVCCKGQPELCGYSHLAPLMGMARNDLRSAERGTMVRDRIYRVLFLCTRNSARSIMAESILNHLGEGKFNAYSAGSHPKGRVHPYALETLRNFHYPTAHFRSKSWDEFTRPGTPAFDFIFTLCDTAAQEVCPVWPGQPITAHWGLPDPAAVAGSETAQRLAFVDTMRMLTRRLEAFVQLPAESLDRGVLQAQLNAIDTAIQEEE